MINWKSSPPPKCTYALITGTDKKHSDVSWDGGYKEKEKKKNRYPEWFVLMGTSLLGWKQFLHPFRLDRPQRGLQPCTTTITRIWPEMDFVHIRNHDICCHCEERFPWLFTLSFSLHGSLQGRGDLRSRLELMFQVAVWAWSFPAGCDMCGCGTRVHSHTV